MTGEHITKHISAALILFGVVTAGAFYVHLYVGFCALIVLCLVTFEWFKRLHEVHGMDQETRGRELKSVEDAKKTCDERRGASDPGVLWGTLRIKTSDATNHFCVAGAVGSGKTLTIRMLMRDQLPHIRKGSKRRALVYDAKQDMVPIVGSLGLGCPIHILNPFDKRSSAWNIARDIDSPAAARQLAVTLVPTDKKESQPFFSDAVRELLVAVITVFIKTRPGEWTFREVLLVMKSRDLLRDVLSPHEFTKTTVHNFLKCSETTLGSIMGTVVTKLSPYEAIAAAWEKANQEKRQISISDWLDHEYVLILGNDERIRASLELVNQLFVAIAAQHVLTRAESSEEMTWFFFDEFREAGKLPGLESIILRGRSKGCCVVLGFQDIQGVQHVYDEKLGNELVGQCGNKALLRLESPETAEWASKCIGDQERYEYNKNWTTSGQGESRSTSAQKQVRAQILPSEFMEIPPPSDGRFGPPNGLHGVYTLRGIGAFRADYEPAILNGLLGQVNAKIKPFVPAPTEWQYLEGWNEEDDKRLKLKTAAATSSRNGDQKLRKHGLQDIGRMEL